MSFWSQLNPFDTDDGHFWDYVPGVAAARDVAQGKGLGETFLDATPAAPFLTGGQDLYRGGKWLGNKVKGWAGDAYDAYQGVYDEKAKGYDAIQDRVEQLKKDRMAQKDYAYNLADSKFAPTRAAIARVYGDPSGWKL